MQAALAALLDDETEGEADEASESASGFAVDVDRDGDEETSVQLTLGGKPVVPPASVQNLLDSILQDLGDIPHDYLAPADASDTVNDHDDAPANAADHPSGAEVCLYDEWDHQRKH